MECIEKRNGDELTVMISGRLDTITVPEAEKFFANAMEGVKTLTIDLKEVEYVSSAGLRMFLRLKKLMYTQGTMNVINVNETVREVFEITGFDVVLGIES